MVERYIYRTSVPALYVMGQPYYAGLCRTDWAASHIYQTGTVCLASELEHTAQNAKQKR